MAATPIVSVIIVCRNPGQRLHTAAESVWRQQSAPVELIVIDGGSIDGSREWLERQRSRLGTLVSEPDAGVYDAMNKGIAAAQGEWVLFLGSDDRLANDFTLRDAIGSMTSGASIVAGEAIFDDGRIYRMRRRVNPIARNFVHHQSAFYRRALFDEHGRFDTSLRVMADYEFNVRIWKKGARFVPISLRVAGCGVGGLSDRGNWSGYREEITIRHRHFSAWRCAFWDALSALRFLRKQIVCRLVRAHG